jgi:hypothetical protein
MNNFDTHELAWCAGFFDGEGSTYSQLQSARDRKYINVHITLDVAQVNPLLLHKFNNAIGGYGWFHTSKLRTAKFEHVQYIMCLLWKWLGPIKKEQYKKTSREYLLNCWKPKFDRISIYRRDYNKYGSAAMRNKMLLYNIPSGQLINPFEKVV